MGMTGRLEPAHGSFALARGLMRDFRTIVEALVPTMLDTRHQILLGGLVAAELIRDEYARHVGPAFEELAEGYCHINSELSDYG